MDPPPRHDRSASRTSAPAPPSSDASARENETGQASTDDRTGHGRGRNIYWPTVASLTAEYVSNEDVSISIREGHVNNRRISNGEVQVAGDPKSPVPADDATEPEIERPCAVPVEGSGVCLQRLSCKRLNDADVPYRNANSVEFEELEVRRPRLRP